MCEAHRRYHNSRKPDSNRKLVARYDAEGRCVKCGNDRDIAQLKTCMNCRMHAHEGRPYN
jgi:hypothetical protein